QLLNYSSGAGDFKRRRGSIPTVEYNAVYDRHLPGNRRMAFRTAAALLNHIARPWLKNSGL
ncbi:MAG: GNAT family N-acetyltransferase, partial [Verrucomicrobiota bacterium]